MYNQDLGFSISSREPISIDMSDPLGKTKEKNFPTKAPVYAMSERASPTGQRNDKVSWVCITGRGGKTYLSEYQVHCAWQQLVIK